ncbi:hypothetical protein K501DRAFT_265042 [Backusella circina FSU 941]|nr:hypothetical protein K501DRAFT_265042 [Backusella circina FSU 941]
MFLLKKIRVQLENENDQAIFTNISSLALTLRFLNYIGRQRADADMVNILVSGEKKYNKSRFKQAGRDQKDTNTNRRRGKRSKGKKKDESKKVQMKAFGISKKRQNSTDFSWECVVLHVDERRSPRADASTPRSLKRTEYNGLLVLVLVTEHLAFQTCSKCHKKDTENITVGTIPLYQF